MRAGALAFWTAAAALAVFAGSTTTAFELTPSKPSGIVLPPLPFLSPTTTTTTPPKPAPKKPAPAASTQPPAATPVAVGSTVVAVPSSTPLAVFLGETYRYAYPGGPTAGSIPGTWYGYQTVLPVIGSAPGWLEVRLAQRPNQSITWVHTSDVEVTSTPYFLVLDLSTEHLMLFEHGQQVGSYPAGIGTSTDPTPTGDYFVAFQAPPPNSGYGPFVLVTSAHSDVITDWEEAGDAIVAIHGPITSGADAQIGSTGAQISHGCVRLHDADLNHLSPLPAGTPLTIVN